MPIKVIAGLDPASIKNIGWSIVKIDNNKPADLEVSAGTMVMNAVDQPHECLWPMFQAIEAFLVQYKPSSLVIEKTSSFSGGFVTGQVSNCMGVILCCAGKHNIPVEFVYPSHVKKILTGKGKATKAVMKKSVQNILSVMLNINQNKIKYDSDHAYDAVGNILCVLIDGGIIKHAS
jgi:crossover junction endodeoxyribonuclease RuvC